MLPVLVPVLSILPASLGAVLPTPKRLPDGSLSPSCVSPGAGGEDGGLVCRVKLLRCDCSCSVCRFGYALGFEVEGPIATNNNPHLRARITMIPLVSWIVIVLSSLSVAVDVLDSVASEPRGWLCGEDCEGKAEGRMDVVGW